MLLQLALRLRLLRLLLLLLRGLVRRGLVLMLLHGAAEASY